MPDNLRSGVTHACIYQPELNRAYREMARHYGVAVVPARPRKPRDKAKVEAGVQLVERWILAALRHRRFTSLGELNELLRELLGKLNNKPFRKRPESRASLFRSLDQPALRPLPRRRYEHAEWLVTRVHPDYHVQVRKHFYSVPTRTPHTHACAASQPLAPPRTAAVRPVAGAARPHAPQSYPHLGTQTESRPAPECSALPVHTTSLIEPEKESIARLIGLFLLECDLDVRRRLAVGPLPPGQRGQ